MFGFFFFLLFGSLVTLIAGLINPDLLNKVIKRDFFKSRKLVTKYIGIASIVLFVATTAAASTLPEPEKKEESKPAQTEQKTEPKIETREDTKTEDVAFETKNEDDSTLDKGQTKTKQEGKNGVREIKYRITLQDGNETSREKISETITTQPVDKIVLIGTKEQIVATQPTTQTTTQPSTSTNSSGYSCGTKKYCSQMTTCSEARFYLTTCGLESLDRDNDGIPCEDICK